MQRTLLHFMMFIRCRNPASMRYILLSLLLYCCGFSEAKGQNISYAPSLIFRIDNDFFNINIRGTDRYYTDGFFLSYSSQVKKKNLLDRLMVVTSKDAFRIRNLSIGQQIYTPHHIGNPNLQVGDYPYAALLAMRYGNRTIMSSYSLYSQLTLGVQGPMALGEEIQKPLHKKVFHSNVPQGWQYQLPNDIAICYTLTLQGRLFHASNIELSGSGEANIGTLFNNLSIGTNLKIGLFCSDYTPEAWLFARDKQHYNPQIYLTVSPFIRIVQTNSLLEGGPINAPGGAWGTPTARFYHIDRSDLERLMYGYSWMLRYVGYRFSLSFIQNFYSAEIKGLNGHMYGTVAFEIKL